MALELELKDIGNQIDYKTVRQAIFDLELEEENTVILNQRHFDNIALNYRKEHGRSIPTPLRILGVEIKDDTANLIPTNKIGIMVVGKKYPKRIGKIISDMSN